MRAENFMVKILLGLELGDRVSPFGFFLFKVSYYLGFESIRQVFVCEVFPGFGPKFLRSYLYIYSSTDNGSITFNNL